MRYSPIVVMVLVSNYCFYACKNNSYDDMEKMLFGKWKLEEIESYGHTLNGVFLADYYCGDRTIELLNENVESDQLDSILFKAKGISKSCKKNDYRWQLVLKTIDENEAKWFLYHSNEFDEGYILKSTNDSLILFSPTESLIKKYVAVN